MFEIVFNRKHEPLYRVRVDGWVSRLEYTENEMQLVTIKAKSHKGKNKIAEIRRRLPNWNGETWRLKRKETRVLFDSDTGPWGFVEPDTDENTDWCSRWVNLREDDNFTVTANAMLSGT